MDFERLNAAGVFLDELSELEAIVNTILSNNYPLGIIEPKIRAIANSVLPIGMFWCVNVHQNNTGKITFELDSKMFK